MPNLCPFEAPKEETELKRLLWYLGSFFPTYEPKKLFLSWTERYEKRLSFRASELPKNQGSGIKLAGFSQTREISSA